MPTLEIVAHTLNATLATWLGATVFFRGGSRGSPRVFAWLMFLLATWSTAIVIERFALDPDIQAALNAVEDVSAFLLPAAALHIIAALTREGPSRGWLRWTIAGAYALGALAGLQAVLDPYHPIGFTEPAFALEPLSTTVTAIAWMGARMAILGLAIAIAARAFAAARGDHARRVQTGAALGAVTVGAVGGTLRFLPAEFGGPVWLGVALVAAGTVIATYGVLSQGIFLSPVAARIAFRSTMVAAVGIVMLVGFLYLVNAASEILFGAAIPILTALLMVVALAVVDPGREWLEGRLEGGASAETDAYRRLARAIDPLSLTSQRPEEAIQPAIERIARILGLSGATVIAGATRLASVGQDPTGEASAVSLPLGSTEHPVGEVAFGPKTGGEPLTTHERAFLDLAAEFFSSALSLGSRQARQAAGIGQLVDERRRVAEQASQLEAALVGTAVPPPQLRVHALGPFRVEMDGSEVRQWGGPKAGSRQAEAVFAFLFDRGDRGVTKDEMLEVIWPDVDLEHADLAFHRTLVGLRGLLEPDRHARQASRAIVFRNDRYRLSPGWVEWSDVAAFEGLLTGAFAGDGSIERLEEARGLYRGDFLDDCPFYGDSAFVEERRALLRGRFVDLLVALGAEYERRADRPAAASAYRQAVAISGDECPPASAGLGRLEATI